MAIRGNKNQSDSKNTSTYGGKPPLSTNPYNPEISKSPVTENDSKQPLSDFVSPLPLAKPATTQSTTDTNNSSSDDKVIEGLTSQLDGLTDQLKDLFGTENIINKEIDELNEKITSLTQECDELTAKQVEEQKEFNNTKNNCFSLSVEIDMVQQQLINTPDNTGGSGCTTNSEYNSLLSYLEVLKNKYRLCVEGAVATNVSKYNTVFITQIYNTNEYEGNVMITGDPDWSSNGVFYNEELVHNCDSNDTPQPELCNIISMSAGTQTDCVPSSNTYTQEVIVTYDNNPETGTLDINGQYFPITSSPQTVILTGLTADGNPVDVTAVFSDAVTCNITENNLFTAPADCPCNIIGISAGTQTTCVPSSNTYTQEVTVTYIGGPSTGTLDINSQSFGISGSPQTVILTGLTSDGNSVDVTAEFSDAVTCDITENNLFTAPAECTPIDCSMSGYSYEINSTTIP